MFRIRYSGSYKSKRGDNHCKCLSANLVLSYVRNPIISMRDLLDTFVDTMPERSYDNIYMKTVFWIGS